jgi:hypothetical protein
MEYSLKGITKLSNIEVTQALGLQSYAFDLRPRSFNFTPLYNIKQIQQTSGQEVYTLLFENEKDLVLKELVKEFEFKENIVYLEFTGVTELNELDSLGMPYAWHYNPEIKISEVKKAKFLKRVVFSHVLLEHFDDSGELFGFLSLFTDLVEGLEFELFLDWDSSILESAFSYFHFDRISFEINSKVESSYQCADEISLVSHIKRIQELNLKGLNNEKISTN